MRDEDHQYELDEVHQALEASLDPAHRACSVRCLLSDTPELFNLLTSHLLLHFLLKYLMDRQVCQPHSEPARYYSWEGLIARVAAAARNPNVHL